MITPEYENLGVTEHNSPNGSPMSAEAIKADEDALRERKARAIELYRAEIRQAQEYIKLCRAALRRLGAIRERKAEPKKRGPGRPKGSRNRVTTEPEAQE